MDITEVSIIHHIALVIVLLWIFASFGWCHPALFFVSLLYLYKVNERYSVRLRRKFQFEERKYANQRRLLSDSESVRWLNHVVEKAWPICMEEIASQQFLLPIIPWFLEKYKPWTARKAVVEHLYLGRSPPMFTGIRVLGESADDDHLVLELGMNFLSADDMSAIIAVQLRKTLGFGIWAKMHVTGMHVEGKVLVGVKFLQHWPFLSRVRVCFVEPPYFQMTVKPIFSHGVDVTELPGIAGWLDKVLSVALEQTLVEPNMLVVDVEKFASKPKERWFSVDEKRPIAFAKVEILEAADLKPSDLNGLADPYVIGKLGPYRFRTKVQKKTLAPKWLEEFKIPISSWEAPNVLFLEGRDKDPIFDDKLGDCSININDLRNGQRHDMWLPLRNIKMGRLHLAITALEDEKGKVSDDKELSRMTETTGPRSSSVAENYHNPEGSLEKGQKIGDEYEPINVEGQQQTSIWVEHSGSDVSQRWEHRKGRAQHPETKLHRGDSDCIDNPRSIASGSHHSDNNNEEVDGKKFNGLGTIWSGLREVGSIFHRRSKNDSPRHYGEEILDDISVGNIGVRRTEQERSRFEKGKAESPGKGHVRGIGKSIVKNAGKPGHSLKNVLSKGGPNNTKDGKVSTELDGDESSQGSNTSNGKESTNAKERGVPGQL